jgi:hypothetical protein
MIRIDLVVDMRSRETEKEAGIQMETLCLWKHMERQGDVK